jgi:hypothetical protein
MHLRNMPNDLPFLLEVDIMRNEFYRLQGLLQWFRQLCFSSLCLFSLLA